MITSSGTISLKKATCYMADAVVLTDTDGRIIWVNQAFHDLCGYSYKQIMNKRPGDFLQGRDTDPETVKQMREGITSESYVCVDILNYHKNGHPYWVSISVSPIRNSFGELEGFIAIARDISKQRYETQRLKTEISEIYGALVHEEQRQRPSAANKGAV